MTDVGEFKNCIICEDIREENGNKNSLMGVFSGDILVPSFPASIRIAFYFEYVPSPHVGEQNLDFEILIGNKSVGKGTVNIPKIRDQLTTIIIPQGTAVFDAPDDIVIKIGHAERIRKKVIGR